MTPPRRVIVVGGGLAGLVAAYRLVTGGADCDVLLIEASSRLGGKLRTERDDGFTVELGADSFVPRSGEVEALAGELGLGDQIVAAADCAVRSYRRDARGFCPFLAGGGSPVSRPGSLLDNPALSFLGRARVRLEPYVAKRRSDEDESARSFIERRLGTRAYSEVYEPLLGGIFGGDPAELSAAATLAPLVAVEARGGSLLRDVGPPKGSSTPPPVRSFADGMSSLTDRLAEAVRTTGRIDTDAAVTSLRLDGDTWLARTREGREERAETVILALPIDSTRIVLGELGDLPPSLAEERGTQTGVVSLGYEAAACERALDAHGYLNARGTGVGVSACTWSSTKFDGRAPQGHILLRCFIRGDHDPDDIVELSRKELADSLGITAAPAKSWAHTWSVPVYRVGHADRVAAFRARAEALTGIFVAGASYDGVGIEAVIRSGTRAAAAAGGNEAIQEAS